MVQRNSHSACEPQDFLRSHSDRLIGRIKTAIGSRIEGIVSRLPEFSHAPLRDSASAFRLVIPLPRNEAQQIRLQIIDADLKDNVEFTALSYVWGRPKFKKHVEISGHRFSVSRNLWNFLSTVTCRSASQFSPMFIDQLCINSSSNFEKTHQVRQMADIYRSANQVICWLGKETSASEYVMSLVSRESETIKLETTNGVALGKRKPESRKRDAAMNMDDRKLFKYLCRCPYWGRVWIVQEFVLARVLIIQWGTWLIAADDFFEALVTLNPIRFQTTMLAALWKGRADRQVEPRQHMDWNEALQVLRGRKCANGKDKVHALLGLVRQGRLQPDYRKSMEEIWQDLVRDMHSDGATSSKIAFLQHTEEWRALLGVSKRLKIPERGLTVGKAGREARRNYAKTHGRWILDGYETD